MFPCRPVQEERRTRIGAAVTPIQLHSCAAGGAIFSLAAIDAADPAGVTPMLDAIRAPGGGQPGRNGDRAGRVRAARRHAQPSKCAASAIAGKRPDGRRVVAQAAFFVKGLRLYQATVLNADVAGGPEAADTFFGAIRLL